MVAALIGYCHTSQILKGLSHGSEISGIFSNSCKTSVKSNSIYCINQIFFFVAII